MIEGSDRNTARIIELPACKMVWSGVCTEKDPFSENGLLRRFESWWNSCDALRADRFYARDFMWWDPVAGGLAWGLAVSEVPEDTGGFPVMNFPGGLYAAANFVDDGDEPGDGMKTASVLSDWVERSGCFEADPERFYLNHFIGTTDAKAAMGYGQQDMYMPIRVREEVK